MTDSSTDIEGGIVGSTLEFTLAPDRVPLSSALLLRYVATRVVQRFVLVRCPDRVSYRSVIYRCRMHRRGESRRNVTD
jgi:hypothetical protein